MANEPAEINREQIRYIGEKTALRFFNLKDPRDLKRVEETLADKSVMNFTEGIDDITTKDIKRWLTRYKDKKRINNWEVCYLASGSIGARQEEFGEIQGFINFYPSEDSRKFLPEKYREAKQIVEIGYARYPWSKPGQMSSAIRQACMEINKLKGDMVITALIKVENNASIKTIEDSCFDNCGNVQVKNEKGEDENDILFILNWDKLNTRLHTQAESILLNTSTTAS